MSQIVGEERGSVVTAHLVLTSAERSRTVVVADNHVRISGEATLEVRAYGGYEDEEAVLLRGMNTNLSAGTDEQRTDVERGAALVGRNPLLVETYHLLHHLREQLGAYLGHHDAATGRLQTGCILVDAENTHLAVRAAIGLQTLECLLAIVQAGGCHVQFQILVGTNLNFSPLTVAIVATYIVVGLHVAK